jgi:hypothetical protein
MPMEWQTLYYKPHFETKVKEQKVKIYILQVSWLYRDQEFHLH